MRSARGAAVVLLLTGGLAACGNSSDVAEPAARPWVQRLPGGAVRMVLTPQAVARAGVRTTAAPAPGTVVPASAVTYAADGTTVVYRSPGPRTFVRERVRVARIEGEHAVLAAALGPGVRLVTVGAPELEGIAEGVGVET